MPPSPTASSPSCSRSTSWWPAAHKAGRHRFVSGKARANTVKALVITDAEGRLLFCGQTRPGSIHDLTQVRQAGLVELLAPIPGVTLLADADY